MGVLVGFAACCLLMAKREISVGALARGRPRFEVGVARNEVAGVSAPVVRDRRIARVPSHSDSEVVDAVQHIRRMRGGAQGHLMRCADGHYYVVKFANNPQHSRVLANEMIASRLARAVGLPVPVPVIVRVEEWLVKHTAELSIQLAHNTVPCEAGLQFGSRYVVDPMEGQVFDYIPAEMLGRVRNLEEFAGMLVVDKWTGNANGRQAAFWRELKSRDRKYTASFIDQGYCFNAGDWNFPDFTLRGVYARNEVYEGVSGWESFEPWLSLVEGMDKPSISRAAGDIPPRWYGEWEDLEELVRALVERRKIVRKLIEAFRDSPRRPFPGWGSVEGLEKAEPQRTEGNTEEGPASDAREKDSRAAGQLVG